MLNPPKPVQCSRCQLGIVLSMHALRASSRKALTLTSRRRSTAEHLWVFHYSGCRVNHSWRIRHSSCFAGRRAFSPRNRWCHPRLCGARCAFELCLLRLHKLSPQLAKSVDPTAPPRVARLVGTSSAIARTQLTLVNLRPPALGSDFPSPDNYYPCENPVRPFLPLTCLFLWYAGSSEARWEGC
jgi:hypothetical protein